MMQRAVLTLVVAGLSASALPKLGDDTVGPKCGPGLPACKGEGTRGGYECQPVDTGIVCITTPCPSKEWYCVRQPEECPKICLAVEDPVCDSNGKEYSNECHLTGAICDNPGTIKWGKSYDPVLGCDLFDCKSRMAWTPEQQEWCCANKVECGPQPPKPPQPLEYGDLCQSGGVTSGLGLDRKDDCPRGLMCKGRPGVFAIGGEVDKFCLRPCEGVDCGDDAFCRETCDFDNVNYECAAFKGLGERCGGFTRACNVARCYEKHTCLDLEPLMADEPGVCSKCDQTKANECSKSGGTFDALTCDCNIIPLSEGDVCEDWGLSRDDCPAGTECRTSPDEILDIKFCLPKKEVVCRFQGQEFPVGATYDDDCNTCVCGENGVGICTEQACAPCDYEHQLCIHDFQCIFYTWNLRARCVERQQCKPDWCALNSKCEQFLCTEKEQCSNHYSIGHCHIPQH